MLRLLRHYGTQEFEVIEAEELDPDGAWIACSIAKGMTEDTARLLLWALTHAAQPGQDSCIEAAEADDKPTTPAS
jgi:hypothetical protein